MKVKLQKHLAYKYKDKQHFKHVIIIPDEAITELGWKGGQDLDLEVKDRKLVLQLASEKTTRAEK